MHLEIFLNGTIGDFEAWVHWRTESDRNPHYDASRDFLWFHPAEIRKRSADRVIMQLSARIQMISPSETTPRWLDLRAPIVFQITRGAPGRIKVEAFGYPPEALPFFFELLDDIAEKWPETGPAIAAFRADPAASPAYDARDPWEEFAGGRGQKQNIVKLWYEGKTDSEIETALSISKPYIRNTLSNLRIKDPERMKRIDDEHARRKRERSARGQYDV